ncbi:hypothetical protein [Amycolatopsis sp. NPDC059021]|uniref:hypothetical protein n=1 Tax=Amycolatopsis sp. NPDC059021 TaxID=3346704 RepID=UPI00366D14A6
MTSPTADIDPLDATTVAEFAACLRQVRLRAGNPSYRALQQWGARNKVPLPRSTVQDALAGRRLPRKSLVLGLIRACGVPVDDRRWENAWTRLAGQAGSTPAPPRSDLHRALTRDLQPAGLLRVGATYLGELEWKQLFAEVTELDIVVAYGQTWRNLHARELAQVAARPGSRIRVFLADPDHAFTLDMLADRFDITPEELRTRIVATRRAYGALRHPGGARIEVYYRPGDRVFSFYRFDDIAVVGLYSHSRARGAAVPVFVCVQPGELYDFVQDELAVILDQSRLV